VTQGGDVIHFLREVMHHAMCIQGVARILYWGTQKLSAEGADVCKLCSNSSDEFQFQAFPTFFQNYDPEVK